MEPCDTQNPRLVPQSAADLHTCLLMSQWLPSVMSHGLHIWLGRNVCVKPQAVVLLENAEGEVLKKGAFIRYDAAEAAHLQQH